MAEPRENLNPDVPVDVWAKHSAHEDAEEKSIGSHFFDPRQHCAACRGDACACESCRGLVWRGAPGCRRPYTREEINAPVKYRRITLE